MIVGSVTAHCAAQPSASLMRINGLTSTETPTVEGRILVTAQDGGLLLEDRSGRIHQLRAGEFQSTEETGQEFVHLNTEELAASLLRQTGGAFQIRQTDHYVLCSSATELYTEYVAQLLEKTHNEFRRFMESLQVPLKDSAAPLPVIVFGDSDRFLEFAGRQHPETSFADVPGYYSLRHNQMLITAPSGMKDYRSRSDVLRELKRQPRQVETVVHEAVHQLAFNTGVQVRYADNPMWLSEGLAVYFESANGRSATLWNRPGEPNRIHLPGAQTCITNEERFQLSLTDLVRTDAAFLSADTAASAYAESWALVHYLTEKQPKALGQLLKELGQRTPLIAVSPESRVTSLTSAAQQTLSELETQVVRHIKRMRSPR